MNFEVYHQGLGQPLLFLGGANTTIDFYRRFLDKLSRHYEVYFFNYPGFGKTDRFVGPHSLGEYLNAIDRFVKKFRLKDFHLAGSSFGGFLAMAYLHHYQPKIKSLILLSPLTRLPSRSLLGMGTRILWGYWQKSSHNDKSLTESIFSWVNFNNIREKLRPSHFVVSCEMPPAWIAASTPTLVVVGEKDHVVDINYTRTLFAGRENIKVVVLAGQGHNGFATVGIRIFTILRNFTDRL